jgi:hypothetical protein
MNVKTTRHTQMKDISSHCCSMKTWTTLLGSMRTRTMCYLSNVYEIEEGVQVLLIVSIDPWLLSNNIGIRHQHSNHSCPQMKRRATGNDHTCFSLCMPVCLVLFLSFLLSLSLSFDRCPMNEHSLLTIAQK